ncbi:MAG: BspA family leucine-rich repeat surface protein [Spirochaetota bacterium]
MKTRTLYQQLLLLIAITLIGCPNPVSTSEESSDSQETPEQATEETPEETPEDPPENDPPPPPTFTITYDGNGAGSGAPPEDATEYEEGEEHMVAQPGSLALSDHDFAGWNTAADGSGDSYAPGSTYTFEAGDIILYAQWSLTPTFRVYYNKNFHPAGEPPVDDTFYRQGDLITVKEPGSAPENWRFSHWSRDWGDFGPEYHPGDTLIMGMEDVTFYAIWEPDLRMQIVYDSQGHTSGQVPVDTGSYSSEDSPIALEAAGLGRYGHVFAGWNTNAGGAGTSIAPGDPIPFLGQGEHTLYAQWTEVEPAFVTTWDSSSPVELPLIPSGTYDFFVSVAGTPRGAHVTSYDDPDRIVIAHDPTVHVWGTIEGLRVMDADQGAYTLTEVSQWGPFSFGEGAPTFNGATALTITATDAPDLSSTTSFEEIFRNATSLTDIPGIGDWDVSAVTTMEGAFSNAALFNSDISKWDTSSVTTMAGMFSGARAFNQPIGSWDTSGVTDMTTMFFDADSFDQDLPWDTSSVTSMAGMFHWAEGFAGDVSGWDTSSVKHMDYIFAGPENFNPDIGDWDVSQVEYFDMAFIGTKLDQDLSGWKTSSAKSMTYMFAETPFNHPLDTWDVSNVTSMEGMFAGTTAFDQDLGSWDISGVGNLDEFLSQSQLSTANYDKLLIGWAAQSTVPSSITFDAGSSKYSAAASAARAYLTSVKSWTISDGGME